MSFLKIRLNQDYKSFSSGFEFSFDEKLIVISWVNWSGKSQLMEIIKWHYQNDPNKIINSNVFIDDVIISDKSILYRSFQSNIQQIHNIWNAEPQTLLNHKNSVWNNYTNWILLNENHQNLKNFQKASKWAKNILIAKFWEAKFSELKREEVLWAIGNEFIWESDDIFSNIVANSFLIYADKISKLKIEKYTQKIFLSDDELEKLVGIPPWKTLNILFESLKIDYRFNDSYTADLSWISEQPRLYPVVNGIIDKSSPREVTDLSDWEKVITSLIFSTLNSDIKNNVKLLLLDEFDATFNPSLTEMFYKVLKDYFIDKWVTVIIVTHSPTTISLAPEDASFYEVFRYSASQRILPVHRNQYNELQIANKEFYDKIGNQEERIQELVNDNKEISLILENKTKPLLFVEWPTDRIILEQAWHKLYPNESIPFFIPEALNGQNAIDVKRNLERASCYQNPYVLWLFDFDWEWFNQWNGLDQKIFLNESTDPRACLIKKHKDNPFYGILLPLNNSKLTQQLFDSWSNHFKEKSIFSIELMFYGKDNKVDAEYFWEKTVPGWKTVSFIENKKTDFASKVSWFDKYMFEGFQSLFLQIRRIISSVHMNI